MGRHILIIEDEANIVEALRFILIREGWTVSTHSNGATAIDTVRSKTPDVIVLDVMLPNKSGFDILREIRGGSDTAEIPVLMLTARGQQKDRDTAHQLGASHFLTKPFSNGEVVDVIDQLHQKTPEGRSDAQV